MGLNPDNLLEQADRLIGPPYAPTRTAPTEEDCRRAISTAYYALFHCAVGALAELHSGTTDADDPLYERIYRRPEHKEIFDRCKDYVGLCRELRTPDDPRIAEFAKVFQTLKLKRENADYNPAFKVAFSEAKETVATARRAITEFRRADARARKTFLGLILFLPKGNKTR